MNTAESDNGKSGPISVNVTSTSSTEPETSTEQESQPAHSGSSVPTRVPKRRKPGGTHLWKSGESGNPRGRPQGSKNKLTLLREAQMEKQEKKLLRNYPEIMEVVIQQAKEGCRSSQKLLIDYLERQKNKADEKQGGGSKEIVINISGAKAARTSGRVVEAEFEELDN